MIVISDADWNIMTVNSDADWNIPTFLQECLCGYSNK
jgi:hypothetical protein